MTTNTPLQAPNSSADALSPQAIILVTGDRHWTDYDLIEQQLRAYPKNTLLIHGDNGDHQHKPPQFGVDRIAACIGAYIFMLPPKAYPAQWHTYGLSAGPRRNRQMLQENPGISMVLAFHDTLGQSRGTKDMVKAAISQHIPVRLYTHAGYYDQQDIIGFIADGMDRHTFVLPYS